MNEAQKNAALEEVLASATRYTQQHVEHLQRLEATGGPEAVLGALRATGFTPGAMAVLEAAYRHAGTFEGVAAMVTQDLQQAAHENQIAVMNASADHWQPKDGDTQAIAQIKRDSPFASMLRDPAAQLRAAELAQKVGLQVAPGQSPLEAVLIYARDFKSGSIINEADLRVTGSKAEREMIRRLGPDDAVALIARQIGEDPRDLAALLNEVDGADVAHEFASRLAVHDKPMIEVKPEARTRLRQEEGRRQAIERAYEDASDSSTRQQHAAPSYSQPATTGRRAALEAAFDEIDDTESEDTSAGYETDRRSALENEYDRLSEEEAA